MKTYLLCKSKETLVSLRLAGIEGKVVEGKDDIKEEIENLLKDKDVGIIAVSESLAERNRDYIMEKKLEERTLFIQVPEPSGTKNKNYVMNYIKNSIGIKI